MDQNEARQLFEDGAVLLFFNVPEETEFGIDMMSWNTGENFKGIKMIPPGLHYVYYNAVGSMGNIAPRVGFIHNFVKSEILVMTWDKKTEDISPITPNEDQLNKYRANLKKLDRYLGPYPYDILEKWKGLTMHIHDNLIKKLLPKCGQIRSALELVSPSNEERRKITKEKTNPSTSNNDASTSNNSASTSSPPTPLVRRSRSRPGIDIVDDDFLPDLKPIPGTELRLTKIPDKNFPDDATPAEITKHSLDSSYVLEQLISEHERPEDLIGELQFSFVCFLVGHSLEAFEHWKRLTNILCSCEEAITKHRRIYDLFITVLEKQLAEIQEDFLADIVSNNNFVYCKLRVLFRTIILSDIDGYLKTKARRFKDNLTNLYQWDFSNIEDEEEDEAPVIVEM